MSKLIIIINLKNALNVEHLIRKNFLRENISTTIIDIKLMEMWLQPK
ncbi:MAG: hypothetical protein WBA93_19535 [Microcoleaceae cyanobacterium]